MLQTEASTFALWVLLFRPHQSQQLQHARLLVVALRKGLTFLAESGSSLDRQDKSFYPQSLNGRRQIGFCHWMYSTKSNSMEFTHQWQPSSPQPSHTNVRNGVQVSGCFPSCWNPRIQFTCLNPQRNLLPPICHNNCTLPVQNSKFRAWLRVVHRAEAAITCHLTQLPYCLSEQGVYSQRRSGWLQQSKGKGRAAKEAIKITFLAMYATSGVDLTSRILHQANLQFWALGSSLCVRTVSRLVARVSWAYFGFLATFVP